jgi:hypothetical protein
MPHITDEEEWELYCLNRLGDARRDEIDEHLLWCTPCQAAYHDCAETTEVFTAALREVFRQPQLSSGAEAHRLGVSCTR